jgi:hypothetical protein
MGKVDSWPARRRGTVRIPICRPELDPPGAGLTDRSIKRDNSRLGRWCSDRAWLMRAQLPPTTGSDSIVGCCGVRQATTSVSGRSSEPPSIKAAFAPTSRMTGSKSSGARVAYSDALGRHHSVNHRATGRGRQRRNEIPEYAGRGLAPPASGAATGGYGHVPRGDGQVVACRFHDGRRQTDQAGRDGHGQKATGREGPTTALPTQLPALRPGGHDRSDWVADQRAALVGFGATAFGVMEDFEKAR